MSDFAGYARTNLFKVRDVDACWADLSALGLPLSRLQSSESFGLLWAGSEGPFSQEALKHLIPVILTHADEPVFFIVAGAVRGDIPLLECTVVDPKSKKIKRNTLGDLTKGYELDLSDAPIMW